MQYWLGQCNHEIVVSARNIDNSTFLQQSRLEVLQQNAIQHSQHPGRRVVKGPFLSRESSCNESELSVQYHVGTSSDLSE